jgi:hypothetical protein
MPSNIPPTTPPVARNSAITSAFISCRDIDMSKLGG